MAVYVVQVTLKTAGCDKRNITLLAKLIDQRMLFVLQYGESARLAACCAGQVLISDCKPLAEWKLTLRGFDLKAVWENAIAQIAGIDLRGGKDLEESIIARGRCEKLTKKIVALEKKAMQERQPRRKWELAGEIKRLKDQLKGEI